MIELIKIYKMLFISIVSWTISLIPTAIFHFIFENLFIDIAAIFFISSPIFILIMNYLTDKDVI